MQEDEKLQECISDSLQKRITKTQEDIETKQTEKAQQKCQKSESFFFNFLTCVFVFLIPSAIWAFPAIKSDFPRRALFFYFLFAWPLLIMSLLVAIGSYFLIKNKSSCAIWFLRAFFITLFGFAFSVLFF